MTDDFLSLSIEAAERNTTETVDYEYAGRALLEVSYDGSFYSGWQFQPNHPTVQGELENTLKRLYRGLSIKTVGSSRTDTGVHALAFAASYLLPEMPSIPVERLQTVLNRQLPSAIRIRSVREVPVSFHVRYDTVGKAYTYLLNRGECTPFNARYSWPMYRSINVDAIRMAGQHLVGTYDFSSFVVERSQIDNAVRTIYAVDVQEFGPYVALTFRGNGFLYKMIRCIVGALEAVGRGVLAPDDIARIRDARDRSAAPETAPANGLFLMKVFYDFDELMNFSIRKPPFEL